VGYKYRTPAQRKRQEAFLNEREPNFEYECAYDIVRAAMELFEKPDLQKLQIAMYSAHFFLDMELDDMPEKVQELGLDVWIAEQEKADEQEEQERLDEEEAEREQREEEEEQEGLEQEERLKAASRNGDSESA
jgi:hypothetical protein